jgi:hypothetical protein
MKGRLFPLLLAAMLCAPLSSCLSYHSQFQKSVAAANGKYEDPTGPWKGRWLSKHNGHEGALWCIVSETPNKPGFYDFRYRAGWGLLKFGDYTHTVEVQKNPAGELPVKGDMELPKFVGTYSLDGSVSKDAFKAAYKSTTGDHGDMTLTRPPAPKKEEPQLPAPE